MGEAIDLLVGAEVLYPLDDAGAVVLDGEVAVVGDLIVYAGPRQPSGTWVPKRSLDGRGRAVLPGFVNCHSHAASVVFRSQSDDGAGGGALYSVAFRAEKDITPAEWRDLAFVGVLDMIKAGITTINDIWYEPEALAEAAAQAGLRAEIAQKVFDVRLEELYRGDYSRHAAEGEARLRRGVDLVETLQAGSDGLVTGRIGPHASDTCSPELLREAAAEARRLKVGTHIHVAQSPSEVAHIREAQGKGPAEYLHELGVLGPQCVAAHLTFAAPEDLEAMRAAGAGYAHCATIYPRRGVYPDVPAIQERGIPWGLATDWMMNDPFEAMRNALNSLRLRAGRHDVLTSREALARATSGAAEVLGRGDELGRLAPGFKADLIQLDIAQPHLEPFYADHASIAFYARAADVVTSVINGCVVMEDRQVLGLDEADILVRARRHLPKWAGLMRKLGGVGHASLCGCGG